MTAAVLADPKAELTAVLKADKLVALSVVKKVASKVDSTAGMMDGS